MIALFAAGSGCRRGARLARQDPAARTAQLVRDLRAVARPPPPPPRHRSLTTRLLRMDMVASDHQHARAASLSCSLSDLVPAPRMAGRPRGDRASGILTEHPQAASDGVDGALTIRQSQARCRGSRRSRGYCVLRLHVRAWFHAARTAAAGSPGRHLSVRWRVQRGVRSGPRPGAALANLKRVRAGGLRTAKSPGGGAGPRHPRLRRMGAGPLDGPRPALNTETRVGLRYTGDPVLGREASRLELGHLLGLGGEGGTLRAGRAVLGQGDRLGSHPALPAGLVRRWGAA